MLLLSSNHLFVSDSGSTIEHPKKVNGIQFEIRQCDKREVKLTSDHLRFDLKCYFHISILFIKEEKVCTTPFGLPVEPEVKITTASSSNFGYVKFVFSTL